MSKHTPGPWVKTGGGMLLGADGTDVVAAGIGLGLGADSGDGIRKANARLIAAAPDLLDELVQARNTIHSLQSAMTGQFFQEQIDRIDAAIKKATT